MRIVFIIYFKEVFSKIQQKTTDQVGQSYNSLATYFSMLGYKNNYIDWTIFFFRGIECRACLIITILQKRLKDLFLLSQEHFLQVQSNSRRQAHICQHHWLLSIEASENRLEMDRDADNKHTYVSLPRIPSLSNFWAVKNL